MWPGLKVPHSSSPGLTAKLEGGRRRASLLRGRESGALPRYKFCSGSAFSLPPPPLGCRSQGRDTARPAPRPARQPRRRLSGFRAWCGAQGRRARSCREAGRGPGRGPAQRRGEPPLRAEPPRRRRQHCGNGSGAPGRALLCSPLRPPPAPAAASPPRPRRLPVSPMMMYLKRYA